MRRTFSLQRCKSHQKPKPKTERNRMPPVAKPAKPAAAKAAAPNASPSEGADETPKPGAKPKAEAVPNEELVGILLKYDEHVEQAQTFYVEFCRFVQKNQIGRAEVVASIMRARGCTFETASSQYSRMKNILNDKQVLDDLEAGKITLKVAREKTTKAQANPKSAKPEAKQERYDKAQKALVDAVKESGYDLKSAVMSYEAALKSAGVK